MAAKKRSVEGRRLIDLYREEHNNHKRFLGLTGAQHTAQIASLVHATNAKSLLDYGCGKGMQYLAHRVHFAWGGILPHCYDPGFPPLAEKPEERFDGVICTDVLEHVPEADIEDVLLDLFAYSRRFVFLTVSITASRKTLSDGTPCHVTVRPPEWWKPLIERYARATVGVRTVALFMDGRSEVDALDILGE